MLLGAGVGERTLAVAPEALPLVVSWIDGGAERLAHAAEERPALRAGDVRDIQTKGTRLEDRKR
ncbi:MAG: hypothetical protein R3F59_37030 [Myxococcota bacterium]